MAKRRFYFKYILWNYSDHTIDINNPSAGFARKEEAMAYITSDSSTWNRWVLQNNEDSFNSVIYVEHGMITETRQYPFLYGSE